MIFYSKEKYWCERRDSNSHALRRWNLNPVRLPIPPLSQVVMNNASWGCQGMYPNKACIIAQQIAENH